ncbi:MAG: hypothetical protein JXR94_16260 [Candidatus Hydrogenedentes bacterium]|nr:hypothetical protein [Candidatus Hydrogenedentota bacterium]
MARDSRSQRIAGLVAGLLVLSCVALADDTYTCPPCPEGDISPGAAFVVRPGQTKTLGTANCEDMDTRDYTYGSELVADSFERWWTDSAPPDEADRYFKSASHTAPPTEGENRIGTFSVGLYIYDLRAYDHLRHDGKGSATPEAYKKGVQNGYRVDGLSYTVIVPRTTNGYFRGVYAASAYGYLGSQFYKKFKHVSYPSFDWTGVTMREYITIAQDNLAWLNPNPSPSSDYILLTEDEARSICNNATGNDPLTHTTHRGITGWWWDRHDNHGIDPADYDSIKQWFAGGKTRGKIVIFQKFVLSNNAFNTDPDSDGYVGASAIIPNTKWPVDHCTNALRIDYYFYKLGVRDNYTYNPAIGKIAHCVPAIGSEKDVYNIESWDGDGYPDVKNYPDPITPYHEPLE